MRLTVLGIILGTAAVAQADILYARDGSCYYGQVVSERAGSVVFRVSAAAGQSLGERVFAAGQIQRIERTGRWDVPPAAVAEPAQPAAGADCVQMLREGFELLSDGNLPAAVRAMQKAVQAASPAVLAELEALTSAAHDVPLADLLAHTRIRVAAQAAFGRGFRLRSATDYERPALGRLLRLQSEILLARQYQGRSVAAWAAARAEYTTLQPDARRLVADASRTAALLAARLRYDPALAADRSERARLTQLRRDLMQLAARILALPGILDLSPEDGWEDPAWLPIAAFRGDAGGGLPPATGPAALDETAPDESPDTPNQ